MNKGGTQEVAGVKVTMVHAVHSCGIQEEDGSFIYGGEACGYVLEFSNGLKLYHAGDTAVFSDMQIIHDLYRPDVALLPMGDHFTMGIREAEYACKLLKPRVVVPMHFGTFPMLTGDPHELGPAAKRAGFELWEMQPGVRRELASLGVRPVHLRQSASCEQLGSSSARDQDYYEFSNPRHWLFCTSFPPPVRAWFPTGLSHAKASLNAKSEWCFTLCLCGLERCCRCGVRSCLGRPGESVLRRCTKSFAPACG